MIGIDFDGTILDSSFRHQKVLYDVLNELGFSTTLEELDDLTHHKRNGKTTIQYLVQKNICSDRKMLDSIGELWVRNVEKPQYLCLDRLYEDSMPILKKLKPQFDLYLVSARQHKNNLHDQINLLGINNYFREVFVVSPGKHASSLKSSATRNLHLQFIIGDTEMDYEWAQNIGCLFFALNRGFRNQDWWKIFGINSFANLYDIYDRIISK